MPPVQSRAPLKRLPKRPRSDSDEGRRYLHPHGFVIEQHYRTWSVYRRVGRGAYPWVHFGTALFSNQTLAACCVWCDRQAAVEAKGQEVNE